MSRPAVTDSSPATTVRPVVAGGAAVRSAAGALVLVLLAILLTVIDPLTPAARAAEETGATQTTDGQTSDGQASSDDLSPLTVTISQLSPSVLTATGGVTLRGVVSNESDQTWPLVNVHPITSHTPMTSTAELREAAVSGPEALWGERITDTGAFEEVGALEPGQSRSFSITVTRDQLGIGTAPGIYQIGVHAMSTDRVKGRFVAGRARLFLPLVTEPAQRSTSASLLVPLRARVNRDVSGHLVDLDRWSQLLRRGGRLHDLVDLGQTGQQASLSWLVDPAVLEAVEQIAAGNPADQLLIVTEGDEEEATPAEEPTSPPTAAPTPSSTPTTVPVPGASDGEETTVPADLQASAQRWLSRATALLRDSTVLSLPYGDVDVNGAARAGSDLVAKAATRSQETLDRLQIESTPTLSSASEELRPAVISKVPAGAQVLTDRSQLPDTDEAAVDDTTSMVSIGQQRVGIYDSFTGSEVSSDAIAMRQRILAEAAVRREEGATSPLVVKLPDDWHPSQISDLVPELRHRWVQWTAYDPTRSASAPRLDAADLIYSESAADEEVPSSHFATASATITGGDQLVRVIDGTSPIGQQTERAVFTTLSTLQGGNIASAGELRARGQSVSDLLGRIKIQAPERVTLSSTSGQFPGTLENDLPVPVLVQLRATTDSNLTLSSPGTLSIPANGRRTIRMQATSKKLGTHQVSLVVTDTDGYPTGGRVDIPVRSASVSVIVWWLIAAGGILLVLMMVRQWRLRGLRRRATPLPDPDAALPVAGTAEAELDQEASQR